MGRVIVAALVLAIVAITGTVAFQAALTDSGEDFQNVNETFVPGNSDIVELDDSNLDNAYYNDSGAVNVYDENNSLMSEPGDYEWIGSNGTIDVNATGELSGDSSGNATYGYVQVSEEAYEMQALLAQVPAIIGLGLMFMIILVLGAVIWQ